MAKVNVPQKIVGDLGTTKVNTKPVDPDDSKQQTAEQINAQNDYLIEQANAHNVNDDRIDDAASDAAQAESIANGAVSTANSALANASANAQQIADLLVRVDLLENPPTGDPRATITWSDVDGGSATIFSERLPESDGVFSETKQASIGNGLLVQAGTLINSVHYQLTGTVPAGLQAVVSAPSLDTVWIQLVGTADSHAAGTIIDAFGIEILDGALAGGVQAPDDGSQMRNFTVTTFDDPAPGQSFFDPLAITTAQANPENATTGNMYMNTDFISDSSTSFPFKDLMKQTRTPISGSNSPFVWDNGQNIAEDADGWPTSLAAGQVVRYLFLWDVPAQQFPGGTYRAEWQGTGTISIVGADSIGASGAGFQEFDLANTSQANIRIDLEATTPGDPLRNLVILAPDPDTGLVAYSAAGPENYVTQPFYPRWLEKMAPFGGIRFMDFFETNFSSISTWQERSRKTHRSYTDLGAPYEVAIEAANKLSANAYINIPAKASDDHVTKLAQSVKADLDASLNCDWELSNEVWNGTFNNLNDGDTLSNYFGQFDPSGTDKQRGYAERSRQVMAIIESVFSGTGRHTKWLGTQAANAGVTGAMLAVSGVGAEHDVIGGAPYAGEAVDPSEIAAFPQITTWTGAQWLSEIQTGALGLGDTIADVMAWLQSQEQHAIAHNMKIGCYEFGYNLVGILGAENDTDLNTALDECYREAGWYGEVQNFWDAYIARTYDTDKKYVTSCWYYLSTRLNKFSRFGAMESVMQTELEADRWRAMKDWKDTNPNQPPAP